MAKPELDKAEERLRGIAFRLEWDEDGVKYQGTGFFISPKGLALTAFHNIPKAVREKPSLRLWGYHGEELLAFRWALTTTDDVKWQRDAEVAVLELDVNRTGKLPGSARLPLIYLPLAWARKERENFWASQSVAAFGFPVLGGLDGELPSGTVRRDAPLQDVIVDGHLVEAAVALADGFQNGETDLTGISGGPLYCRKTGDIRAVVVAANPGSNRVYATELHHVAKNWLPFQKHARCESKGGWWKRIAAAIVAFAVIAGLLILNHRLSSYELIDLSESMRANAEKLYPPSAGLEWVGSWPHGAIRVGVFRLFEDMPVVPGMPFRNGEQVRFAVESPADGHLYVIDRERYANGTVGPPYLIYPLTTVAGGNRVRKGQRLVYPAPTDEPPYMELMTSPNQAGEILTFLIADRPLDVTIGASPKLITAGLFRQWIGQDQQLPEGYRPRLFVHAPGSTTRATVTIPLRVAR